MSKLDAITLRQLRALTSVASEGSITAAARATGLTPPAVHSQLKALAANVGADLLTRGRHGTMELTEVGGVLISAAARIDAELRSCIRDVDALNRGIAGSVRIGVVSTGKYFAPGLVARLKTDLPNVDVRLIIGNRDKTIKALETHDIHLAIMGRPPRLPVVTAEVVGPHPHVIIAAPNHALAAARFVTPSQLLDEVFIAREVGSGTRILMTRYLDKMGDGRPYETIEMDSNETIKQAVIAGLGIALISAHTVADELEHGRLVSLPMDGLPILRQWYLLHLDAVELSPAAARIKQAISAMNGDYLPQMSTPVQAGQVPSTSETGTSTI